MMKGDNFRFSTCVRVDLAPSVHEKKTKYCERRAEVHPCKHESTWCSGQQFTPRSLAIPQKSGCERRVIIVCSVWHVFRHVGRFIRHVPVSMRRINADVTGYSLFTLPNKGSLIAASVFTTTLFVWWYQWRVKMRFSVLKVTGDENTSACLLLLSSSTSAADVNEMRQITWKGVRGAERLKPSTCIIGLTWWTNTSSGGSTGFPSLLVIDINPNPMRTLNHLQ